MGLLDGDSRTPLYMQLYGQIKADIECGRIAAGQRLESGRAVAGRLHVSRNTVDLAYGQLFAEGYITSKPRKGYYVDAAGAFPQAYAPSAPDATPGLPTPAILYDFRSGAAAFSELPCALWRKLTDRCFSECRDGLARQGDVFGEQGLRDEICRHVRAWRGVECAPGQVVVTPSAQFSLCLLCQILKSLCPCPAVALDEGEGSRQARATLCNCGVDVCRMREGRQGFEEGAVPTSPCEGDGVADAGDALRERVAAAYVTPSRQCGGVMPMDVRQGLARRAAQEGFIVIEDDMGCHFACCQRPVAALHSLCAGNAVYIGGFAGIMLPCVQASYMVLPDSLAQLLRGWYDGHAPFVPFLTQWPLETFMREGHCERQIRRTRKARGLKREALAGAISERFGGSAIVSGHGTGGHLAVKALWGMEAGELTERALWAGVGVSPAPGGGESRCLGACGSGLGDGVTDGHGDAGAHAPSGGTVLLDYGGVALADIPNAVGLLHKAWLG